jgi:uncharacterized protein YcfL
MKKLITLFILLAVFLLTGNDAMAQIRVVSQADSNQGDGLFDIKITSIKQFPNSNSTTFEFEPVNVKTSPNIDHWKIRVWCENNISVVVGSSVVNNCGTAVMIKNSTSNKFSLTLNNPTKQLTNFSFKLKAYDATGKWLHSEKESFMWR